MGRPKKSDQGPIPTDERILQKALELFALKGFDAVSVRDITNALDLNQATLYIYFKNKAGLLDAIFDRLKKRLIEPGFKVPQPDYFKSLTAFDLGEFLIEGAKRFFARSDEETRLTWRLLMTNQYNHVSAREGVEAQILDAPAHHFAALFQSIQQAGLLRKDLDPVGIGRIIASMFLEYSFRANLHVAWESEQSDDFERLCADLRAFAVTLT